MSGMQSLQKAFWCEAPKLRRFTPDLPQLSPCSYFLSIYLFLTTLTLTAHLFCLVTIHSNWLPVSVFSPGPATPQGRRQSTFKSWHLRQEDQETRVWTTHTGFLAVVILGSWRYFTPVWARLPNLCFSTTVEVPNSTAYRVHSHKVDAGHVRRAECRYTWRLQPIAFM